MTRAQAWYAKEHKGLAKRFAKAVRDVLKRLRKMPMIHGVVVKDVRRAIVKGFPYVVIYRVVAKEVIIISIFFTKRNPADWESRI